MLWRPRAIMKHGIRQDLGCSRRSERRTVPAPTSARPLHDECPLPTGRRGGTGSQLPKGTRNCVEARMTPEELKLKVYELRRLIIQKLVELEDGPKWGTEEE